MEKPKCKLCGERHWGACPSPGLLPALKQAVSTEVQQPDAKGNLHHSVSPAQWRELTAADSSSAAKQPQRKAKPRDPKLPAIASHQPSQLTEPERLPVMDQLAPPGQCPHCDYRRAKAAEYVRLHRAKRVSLP